MRLHREKNRLLKNGKNVANEKLSMDFLNFGQAELWGNLWYFLKYL